MLFGAKMVLCALAGLSASLRSAANLPAAAHKTSFLLLITYYTINAKTALGFVIFTKIKVNRG
jgi:hypothetical protein